jgi:KDO2-lipid IV(A) lauroyltransferase
MLAVLAYRAAAAGAGVLPAPVADALATALARLSFDARVPARVALEENLRRVLPGLDPRDRRACARGAFVSFALAFTRFLRRGAADSTSRLPIVGREHLDAARATGRGVIVLSAHLGDWESGAAAIAAEGLRIHLAARPQPAHVLERMFAARRSAFGVEVLPVSSAFASMAGVLRRREWVALMADRGAGLGGGASICAWAAALAERTDSLVLPAVCVRDARGALALHVEAPLTPERCRDGAFRDMLQSWLARWPGQWAAFEPLPEGLA